MSKSILNIREIIGQYTTKGTDMPENMAHRLKNLFVDTKAGMAEGARDYTDISIGGTAGTTFQSSLGGKPVKEAVFFSPSKDFEINGEQYTRMLVILVHSGTYLLKFYGIPDSGDFDLVYDPTTDVNLGTGADTENTELVSTGDSLRIVTGDRVRWFGHLQKNMLYVDGDATLTTVGWFLEDAIVDTDGISIDVAETDRPLYDDDDTIDRIYTYAVSVVYDYTQDSSYLTSRVIKTQNMPRLTIGIDTSRIARRITGIKLWRKVGEEGNIYSSMDFELYKDYGVSYDTNDDYDYVVFRALPKKLKCLTSLDFYFSWTSDKWEAEGNDSHINNGSITYGDNEELRRHYRFPQWSYVVPLDPTKNNFSPQEDKEYFLSVDPGNEASFEDFDNRAIYKPDVNTGYETKPMWKFKQPELQSSFEFSAIAYKLWKIEVHDDYFIATLVYGHCLDGGATATKDMIQSNYAPFMNFQAPYDGRYRIYSLKNGIYLDYASSLRLYPKELTADDGSGTSSIAEHAIYSNKVLPTTLDGNLLRITGDVRSSATGSDPLVSAKISYADGTRVDDVSDSLRLIFSDDDLPMFSPKPYSLMVPVYNDTLGLVGGVNENLDNVAGDTSIVQEIETLGGIVTEASGAIVDFQTSPAENVINMVVDDQSKDDVHTNRFYSEEVGFDPKNLVVSYKHPVLFGNRLFVVDESTLRWSESFKYDSFRPESVYEVSSEPTKILPHHDALLLIYENNIDVLNYSGTKETWRTSDSLNKLGTTLTNSILSTPAGVFMVTRYGIFMINSPETAGKMSYYKQTRIDRAIEGEIDLESATPNDIVAYWDSEWERIVLIDNRTEKHWVFSLKKGWMPIEGSAYSSFSHIIPIHDMLNLGLARKASAPIISKLRYDGENLGDYEFESGWITMKEPSVFKKFKKVYLIAEIPSATAIADPGLTDPDDAQPPRPRAN
jgi:hypothetical protein